MFWLINIHVHHPYHEKLLPGLQNSHSTIDSHYVCKDTSTLSLFFCPCAQQLYRIGSLHVTGHSVRATMLRDTIKRTHYLPKIGFTNSAIYDVLEYQNYGLIQHGDLLQCRQTYGAVLTDIRLSVDRHTLQCRQTYAAV